LYEKGNTLGKGAYGFVQEVIERGTQNRFAVKHIPKQKTGIFLNHAFLSRIRCEVDTLNLLAGSLNTAFLYDLFEDDENVMLVFDCLSGGTLGEHVDRLTAEGRFTEDEAALIARNVLQMLAQCHSMGVVHRDVKPDNFLYSSAEPGAPLKAIDFGTAFWMTKKHRPTDRVGTPIFMAPEVVSAEVRLRNPGYDYKADVYSAGVLLYLLLTGRWPYSGENGRAVSASITRGGSIRASASVEVQDVYTAIATEEADFSDEAWAGRSAEARDLVMSMLQPDPENRPSALDALDHSFLSARSQGNAENARSVKAEALQRVQRYGMYPRLKRLALLEIVDQAAEGTADELEELRRLFREADTAGDGELSVEEIMSATERLGFSVTREEVEQLVACMDLNCDGNVQYREWVSALTDWQAAQALPEWDGWVLDVYRRMEGGGDGIDLERLEEIIRDVEDSASCQKRPETLRDALRVLDLNRDGRISLEEFKTMFSSREPSLELFPSRVS